jgi:hypothetical protein
MRAVGELTQHDAENQRMRRCRLSQDCERARGHSAHSPLPTHGTTRRDSVPPTTAARVDGALVYVETLVDWRG